nr:uncharacterized protein LOC129527410 isoform X3 [Gorilla gorilla gorilla]
MGPLPMVSPIRRCFGLMGTEGRSGHRRVRLASMTYWGDRVDPGGRGRGNVCVQMCVQVSAGFSRGFSDVDPESAVITQGWPLPPRPPLCGLLATSASWEEFQCLGRPCAPAVARCGEHREQNCISRESWSVEPARNSRADKMAANQDREAEEARAPLSAPRKGRADWGQQERFCRLSFRAASPPRMPGSRPRALTTGPPSSLAPAGAGLGTKRVTSVSWVPASQSHGPASTTRPYGGPETPIPVTVIPLHRQGHRGPWRLCG